jgi:hypothetical protein
MRSVLFAVVLSWPAIALACPACARDNSPWVSVLIGGMLSVPYLVSLVVVRAVRRADRDAEVRQ